MDTVENLVVIYLKILEQARGDAAQVAFALQGLERNLEKLSEEEREEVARKFSVHRFVQ